MVLRRRALRRKFIIFSVGKRRAARFVKVPAADGKSRELNLWIVGDAGGFQALRFTDQYLQTQQGRAVVADALAE